MDAWNITKKALYFSNPLIGMAVSAAESAYDAVKTAENKGVSELKDELAKQELKLQFETQQARVAQELAIARRIDGALEVEIEEFYEGSGKGAGGLQVDLTANTGTLGGSGETRKVTKRIYRFKGALAREVEETVQRIET